MATLSKPAVRRFPLFSALVLAACSTDRPPPATPVAATAEALDSRSVALTFTRSVIASSVDPNALSIFTPFERPEQTLAVEQIEISGDTILLRTAEQRGGRLYAIRLGMLAFEGVEKADAPAQVNFEGFGVAAVSLRLDTRGFIVPGELNLLVTLDPSSGRYTPDFRAVPLSDADADGVFTATISARVDGDRPYAARAVGPSGVEAGGLVSFTVTSSAALSVDLPPRLDRVPEFEPIADPTPGDGFAPVRIVVDDRFARVLRRPAIRLSLDANGRFDLSLQRVEPLRAVPGKPRVYETVVNVAVDADRRLDGTTPDTFPYVSFVVNDGEDVNERAGNFIMPDENPRIVLIPIANLSLVAVTFRVDVGSALLEPDRSLRGIYPGEGVFLTGEFPNAEDALGRLAADAFTGGERATLEMEERPDAPGIYEKIVFLPPNRPYGWKVVRCQTGEGCAELNRHVTSSGRAFPTVMKNLVTHNIDAASSMEVRVIDPAALDRVQLEDGSFADYSSARVSLDGMEPASPAVMFKQEAPDLVVTVARDPVITPIIVVGTWRDVNIPERPSEIIMSGGTLELGPYDYDDGLAGRAPPIRDRVLPIDPGEVTLPPGQPVFSAADGAADASAFDLSAGGQRLPLFVAWNERDLYVATQLAMPGRDHFIVISLDPPSASRPAHWAKGGTGAAGTRTVFLAMEGDGDFAGWFRRGVAGNDDQPIMSASAVAGRGTVLEGRLDLSAEGSLGTSIWIAAVAYATQDGGALVPGAQNPAGNGDLNLDGVEFREARLAEIRAR